MSDCTCLCDPALARRVVRLCQAGLPLVEDPWAWLARQLGCGPDDALTLLRDMHAAGVVRRVAAVPNHYRLGYRHNGMTVWDVADEDIAELGPRVGALPFVSHCYRRPRRPGWRFNLFAMIHARSAAGLEPQREHIRDVLGAALRAEDMLVSSRILKKTGLRLPPEGDTRC